MVKLKCHLKFIVINVSFIDPTKMQMVFVGNFILYTMLLVNNDQNLFYR